MVQTTKLKSPRHNQFVCLLVFASGQYSTIELHPYRVFAQHWKTAPDPGQGSALLQQPIASAGFFWWDAAPSGVVQILDMQKMSLWLQICIGTYTFLTLRIPLKAILKLALCSPIFHNFSRWRLRPVYAEPSKCPSIQNGCNLGINS